MRSPALSATCIVRQGVLKGNLILAFPPKRSEPTSSLTILFSEGCIFKVIPA